MRFLFLIMFVFSVNTEAAMTAASCKSKIEAAITAQFGVTPIQSPNFIIAICTGIIEEIQTNAVVNSITTVSSGSSSGPHPAVGTVQ